MSARGSANNILPAANRRDAGIIKLPPQLNIPSLLKADSALVIAALGATRKRHVVHAIVTLPSAGTCHVLVLGFCRRLPSSGPAHHLKSVNIASQHGKSCPEKPGPSLQSSSHACMLCNGHEKSGTVQPSNNPASLDTVIACCSNCIVKLHCTRTVTAGNTQCT